MPAMVSQKEALEALTTILQKYIADTSTPGLSAAILTPSACHELTAGHANLGTAQPVQPSHVFGIGSITKVFIATVILQLAEEARLNLSDNVSQHLEPETYANITNASDSTISQLLRHEAGIDSWEDDAEWIAHGRGKDLDPSHVWGKTEPLEYVRRPRKIAPPQGEWYYSNTNYTLLGLVIEAVTANTAEGEIRSRIIEPLGLGIYLEGFEAAHGDMPSRYHWVTDTFRSAAGLCPLFPLVRPDLMDASTSNLSVEWTAGGMLSSARDLVVFGKALRDGRLLKPASLKLMRQWRPTTTLGGEMGHGLFRIKFAGSGESEYWDGHFGGVLGFTAGLWWAEDGDVVVSVFSNVGTMHAGAVPGSGAHVIMNSGFLSAARELARCDDGDAFPA